MPATPGGMILPPFDPATGELREPEAHWRDARVPAGRYIDGDRTEPRVLAHYLTCVEYGARHLFDVIEATRSVQHDDDEHGPYAESHAGDLYLTCVRCGLILRHRGEHFTEHSARVDPAPVAVGTLRAQQINGRDYSAEWAVYDAADLERRLCLVSWGRTTRGREFYATRLDDERLEAPTLAGLLRKIAKSRG